MIQKFDMSDLGVSHLGRYVKTEKFLAETSVDEFRVSAFGTHIARTSLNPDSLDDANPANINVVRFAGELLALWEPGSAYSLDPETLLTRGAKSWSHELSQRPFSAHPRIEPDGTMWNFGIDPF